MHEIDRMPKIVTIIGLVFEGLGVAGAFVGGLILWNFENTPWYDLMVDEMTTLELEEVMDLFSFMGDFIIAIGILTGIFFLVNLVLFTKLISGQFEEPSAKKVYLYQAIWGGINILFNQITGILYLISGVTGYSGHKEERDIREGI